MIIWDMQSNTEGSITMYTVINLHCYNGERNIFDQATEQVKVIYEKQFTLILFKFKFIISVLVLQIHIHIS